VPTASATLHFLDPPSGPWWLRARQLRGAVAAAFADDPAFHQHDDAGRPLYRYPRVQYRWRDGRGVVVGWKEAASRVLNAPWLDLDLQLGNDPARVKHAELRSGRGEVGAADELHTYRLISPVLILNQKNYRHYRELGSAGDEAGQRRERDRLLVAQLLVALREMGARFDRRLYATFTRIRPRSCRLKEQELLGFSGEFVANVLLPDEFAIGHAVSHGYGWIESMREEGDPT